MKTKLVVMTLALAAAVPCLASDAGDLARAQKAADVMLAVFAGRQVPDYAALAENFAPGLKEKLGEKEYAGLKKQVGEKLGQMSTSKFVRYERFDKADRLTYISGFTREKIVALSFGFDKAGKIFEFRLAPVKAQPAPGKDAGKEGKEEPAKPSPGAAK